MEKGERRSEAEAEAEATEAAREEEVEGGVGAVGVEREDGGTGSEGEIISSEISRIRNGGRERASESELIRE